MCVANPADRLRWRFALVGAFSLAAAANANHFTLPLLAYGYGLNEACVV
jgi:hypothetical protein